MASEKVMRGLVCLLIVLAVSAAANAYMMQGLDIVVDNWAGGGSNETIVVIDWNGANGPYITESHAWGFKWDGTAYLLDALNAIHQSGVLNFETQYYSGMGEAFWNAYYNQTLVDGDNHTSEGFGGWWYLGDTADGGLTWNMNGGGIDAEVLWNGGIEGLNLLDTFVWTSDTLTIPVVPEPATITLLCLGGLLLRKHKA
jgi:hypothetical protein